MKPNWRRRAAQQAERDRRALERLCWHESAHATINHAYGFRSHGHGPQKDAASFGYERRGGLTHRWLLRMIGLQFSKRMTCSTMRLS
jgi:hypothetical protein